MTRSGGLSLRLHHIIHLAIESLAGTEGYSRLRAHLHRGTAERGVLGNGQHELGLHTTVGHGGDVGSAGRCQ